MAERVCSARIFRQPRIVEIDATRHAVDGDVLEYCPECARGCINVRFRLGRETDDLCVASPLEVEYAMLTPAVFIVADQRPFRVGGKRRLSRTGETKKQRCVSSLAEIGGAMHRENVAFRQQIIQNRKNGFLDLPCIGCPADDTETLCKTDNDKNLRICAIHFR